MKRARLAALFRIGPRVSSGLWIFAGLVAHGAAQTPTSSRPCLPDPIEWEWRCRRLALEPSEQRSELARALASADWHARLLALEALARLPAGAQWHARGEGLAPLLNDPAPNVRAAALRVVAALDPWQPSVEEALLAGCRDAWPGARLAAIRALADARSESAALELARLALARGSSVERHEVLAARSGLMRFGPLGWREQLRVLTSESAPELLEVYLDLVRGGIAPEQVLALREALPHERALVELLAADAGLAIDEPALLAAWIAPPAAEPGASERRWSSRAQREELLEQIAERSDARLPRASLGPALLAAARAAAADEAQSDQTDFLCRCATSLLGPEAALASLDTAPERVAQAVWDQVELSSESLSPDCLRPWLRAQRAPREREAAARMCARSFEGALASMQAGSATAELLAAAPRWRAMLSELARDLDPTIRHAAFRDLCRAPGVERRVELLFELWSDSTIDEQHARLIELPRDWPLEPFRAVLLEWNEADRGGPSVPELLSALRPDEALRASLAAALWRALDGVSLALERADAGMLRAARTRARSLMIALGRVEGAQSSLLRALERSLEWERGEGERGDSLAVELAKHAVAGLGQSAEGRALLQAYLEPTTPARARIEAALALASTRGAAQEPERASRARLLLLESFETCDSTLRSRILRALALGSERPVRDFLEALLSDPSADIEQRIAALDALAERGGPDKLFTLMGADSPLGLRRACVEAALRMATSAPDARLRDRVRSSLLEAAAANLPVWSAAEPTHPDRLLAGDLLVATCALGGTAPELLASVFAPALHDAAAQLTRRQAGERLPAPGFTRSSELSLAAGLAQRGLLSSALDASGAWWRLDGRFLLALSEVAGPEPDARRRLARAALSALLGEPEGEDRGAALARAALCLWREAARRADWAAHAHLCVFLRDLEARAAGADRAILAELGRPDPSRGLDPWARLHSGIPRARAWLALAAGELPRARQEARVAGERCGWSSAARAEQRELEAALASR